MIRINLLRSFDPSPARPSPIHLGNATLTRRHRQLTLAAIERYEAALAQVEDLLQDSVTATMAKDLGDLYMRLGRMCDATAQYARLADSYGRAGYFLKAIAIWKQIQKFDPEHQQAGERIKEFVACFEAQYRGRADRPLE